MSLPRDLQEKLDRLPPEPGVYVMRDRHGGVVYVGKAVNLRSRVRSYFSAAGGDGRGFVPLLEGLLGDIEVITVGREKEALLLENELIKRHRPRFNVMLRDDKDYISLRLDLRHPHPHLQVWRRPEPDGARYFGPYASAAAVRQTLRVVNRHFQLRTCSDAELMRRTRPCLQYQIGRCPAPCVKDLPDYARHVQDTILFLEGRHTDLVKDLRARMAGASERLAYEEAARLRDQLLAVERTLERQHVIQVEDRVDRDAIGFHREGPALTVQVLDVRQGRLAGGRTLSFDRQEFPTAELLASLVMQIYQQPGALVPEEVLLPMAIEGMETLSVWLSEKRGRRVSLTVPQRGEKKRLAELASENARTAFVLARERRVDDRALLERLQETLGLSRLPSRIEGYDISQIQGSAPVASRVAICDGQPDKARYRRYKIRSVVGQDDYAMMREVLTRRLLRGLEEGDLPDLLVIDGGKGQLGVARAVLSDTAIDEVDVVALAKSRLGDRPGGPADHAAVPDRSPERVFVPGRKDPILLPPDSAELLLLTRLRDEAHRFAVDYHRKLRSKRTLGSRLEIIPGVGPGRRKALLAHFGSLKRLKAASVEEIAQAPGFSVKLASKVHAGLHGSPG